MANDSDSPNASQDFQLKLKAISTESTTTTPSPDTDTVIGEEFLEKEKKKDDVKKRSAQENAHLLQDRMNDRNERRIQWFEDEFQKLKRQNDSLNDETKSQIGELGKLRERSKWKNWAAGFSALFSVVGAVIVHCDDTHGILFYVGVSMIGFGGFLNFLMLIRSF